MRNTLLLLKITLGLLLCGPTPIALAVPLYEIRDLGHLTNIPNTFASGLNNKGQVVGWSRVGPSISQSFLWDEGVMTNLGQVSSGSHFAQDINEHGQVTGTAQVLNMTGGVIASRAFLWEQGTIRDIGTLGGTSAEAFAINDSGQIVGSTPVSSFSHAFIWESNQFTDLGTLPTGGLNSFAFGINTFGNVVGRGPRERTGGRTAAILWRDGQINDLGLLPDHGFASAQDINDVDQIVGFSSGPGGTRGFIWENGTMLPLPTLGGSLASAFAINSSGLTVGSSTPPSDTINHAVIWEDDIAFDLNDLIPGFDWDYLLTAADINDRGQIVGQGFRNGRGTAFLLTPLIVPEPSALVLLSIGMVGLGFRLLSNTSKLISAT